MVIVGDSQRILPVLRLPPGRRVHAFLDPPYEAEAHQNARTMAGGGPAPLAIDFAAITPGLRFDTSRQLARLATDWVLVFCQLEALGLWKRDLETAGARWMRSQTWVRTDGTPQLTGDRPAQGSEGIATAWAGAGRPSWNAGGARGTYTHGVVRVDRKHATQKPLPLLREVVRRFFNPGDVVIDPFCGSGAHLIAARGHGCSVIGIERDYAHADGAAKWLGDSFG